MRFGIISTASIARAALVPAIGKTDRSVDAVASRDESRAHAVADEFGISGAYGSYEELLADPDLDTVGYNYLKVFHTPRCRNTSGDYSRQYDAVYNPLPNGLHAEWTKRAADAGLDVFCEKPLAADAAAAESVATHCRDAGVALMEGFVYRYHPRTERAAELVGVGCYAVSAARLFLGEPDRVYAHQRDSRGAGVDTDLMGILEYDDGAMAHVDGSFDAPEVRRYRVEIENGWVAAELAFNVPADEPATLTCEIDGREGRERIAGRRRLTGGGLVDSRNVRPLDG